MATAFPIVDNTRYVCLKILHFEDENWIQIFANVFRKERVHKDGSSRHVKISNYILLFRSNKRKLFSLLQVTGETR